MSAVELIDISMPLDGRTPVWPGSPGYGRSAHLALAAGDVANASAIEMDVHCGTHVDAPLHFVDEGDDIDQLGLDPLVGPAWVADAGGHRAIDAAVLEALEVPAGTLRLILRTDNTLGPREAPFREDYVGVTPDGARWIADRGLRLIGIDYLSVQLFHDPPDTHQILLGAGIAILEGLALGEVTPGPWTLVCLPLRLTGAEAAPARAVLLPGGLS